MDSHGPNALPLESVRLKIHAGIAKNVMLEAMPEIICPSQMTKSPLKPAGRRNGIAQFIFKSQGENNTG